MFRKKWREQESSCCDFLILKCSVQKGLLSASVISLKLWAHWSLREWMHTDCGIVRAQQGKTRCKRKIGTFMVDVLQLLLPFLPAFVWSELTEELFLLLLCISLHDWILTTSFFSTRKGKKYLLLISWLCFLVHLLWNLFSIWICCASFLLVNALERELMHLHKEEILVFQEIIQNLLQLFYVLLKNAF